MCVSLALSSAACPWRTVSAHARAARRVNTPTKSHSSAAASARTCSIGARPRGWLARVTANDPRTQLASMPEGRLEGTLVSLPQAGRRAAQGEGERLHGHEERRADRRRCGAHNAFERYCTVGGTDCGICRTQRRACLTRGRLSSALQRIRLSWARQRYPRHRRPRRGPMSDQVSWR